MTVALTLNLLRTNPTPKKQITRLSSSFKPRRTPSPTLKSINLTPRGLPTASLLPNPPPPNTALKGGQKEGWISPHHTDYYGKLDDSTMNSGELLHGDPNMPITAFTAGESKVLLGTDSQGREVAKEVDDYRLDYKRGMVSPASYFDTEESDDLVREYGVHAADSIREHLYQRSLKLRSGKQSALDDVETKLRMIDRLTAKEGSTQDLAFMRKARTEGRDYFRLGQIPHGDGLSDVPGIEEEVGKDRRFSAHGQFSKNATVPFPYGKPLPSPTYHEDYPQGSGVGDNPNDEEEEQWLQELNKMIYHEEYNEMDLGELEENFHPVRVQKEEIDEYMAEKERVAKYKEWERDDRSLLEREEKEDEILEMIKRGDDPNQEAFGPWGECTIKVDRVQKVERGGTTVRYRALVIGGNGNGAAGFGIGKALSPNEAIVKACKHCKRNVFYINRYLNSGLTYDLAGKHNSCRVALRAVRPENGLSGHPLICEILQYAGITDCSCKSHGNRNPYNVVYATFKALMTHQSLEEIALKRGKKLLNLERTRRLGI